MIPVFSRAGMSKRSKKNNPRNKIKVYLPLKMKNGIIPQNIIHTKRRSKGIFNGSVSGTLKDH